MRNRSGKSLVKMLALALGIACTQSTPAQTFKRVTVKGGAPLRQIAPGGASVWARASNGNPYIFKTNKFVLASSISLAQLAVGGGNVLQPDAVWGLDSAGNIYKATKNGTAWVFSPVPGALDLIAVGAGFDNCHPYEVWGLNTAAQIFRYNFCGLNFEQVAGTLGSLAVGNGDIWGINGNGEVFRFNFKTLAFERYQFAPPLTQLTVGPNGVWGLDSRSALREFDNQEYFIDRTVGGETFTQVQVGGNGAWGLNFSGQVFRFQPSTGSVVSIPSVFVSISAGSGGSVWGIDGSGKAYGFSTP